ncbi:GIY-YIG nuclease family protein [bacterium]|nr:GIY-YIG nuclease family protein [bacterium]MDA7668744.1 GIY-YIG nuclease family protein [bacterium]MDB4628009.1 GIY-YIG nuclease family protein [bacterium]MDB4632842.1 GIY-YIG nuclease family protein [bacterium]
MEFTKIMTRNDLGLTGSNQSGWALYGPTNQEKFAVFPELSAFIKNDARQIHLIDPDDQVWQLRYIYFNTRWSESRPNGRNEYRLTQGESGQTPHDLADSLSLRVGDKAVFTLDRGEIFIRAVHLDRHSWRKRIEKAAGRASLGSLTADEILDKPPGSFDGGEGNPVPRSRDTDLGHVYVLTNPAMPALCKIGFTTRSAEVRAKELTDHSGVPARFSVVGSVQVRDPARLERIMHKLLESKRFREGREFFQIDPAQAMEYVREVAKIFTEARP